MGWAGSNFRSGFLVNGKRYQRNGLFRDDEVTRRCYEDDFWPDLW